MPQGAKPRLRQIGRRLKKAAAWFGARSGSAAIEFALVAPVFFLFLLGTLETGLIFFGDFVLQNATNDAARQIRTGQVALSNMSQADFKKMICTGISPLLVDCDTKLQIDVQSFTSFSAVNLGNPITSSGALDPSLKNWQTGTVCSIVLVRSFYTYDVVTPLLTPFLVNVNSTQHLFTAAAAFRNEPYTTAVSGC